jgi:hypothetical protein
VPGLNNAGSAHIRTWSETSVEQKSKHIHSEAKQGEQKGGVGRTGEMEEVRGMLWNICRAQVDDGNDRGAGKDVCTSHQGAVQRRLSHAGILC